MTDMEVRAQIIVALLVKQRDAAMNEAVAFAVELAKAQAEIAAFKAKEETT